MPNALDKFVGLAINDGNPITPPNITPMDAQMEGPDEPHAFIPKDGKPTKCAICNRPEEDDMHMGDDGKPFGESDDKDMPNNPGFQGPKMASIKASATLVSLAKGTNPFKKHSFKPGSGDASDDTGKGNCTICGKGGGAAVHQNASGKPIAATSGKMTGEQWSQTSNVTETATDKILRLAGKTQPPININPAHAGEFTAKAKAAGKSVAEFASDVLANKDKYDAKTVEQATFAKNFGGK